MLRTVTLDDSVSCSVTSDMDEGLPLGAMDTFIIRVFNPACFSHCKNGTSMDWWEQLFSPASAVIFPVFNAIDDFMYLRCRSRPYKASSPDFLH